MEENNFVKRLMKKKIRRNYSIHPENIIFYNYFNNLKRKALSQGYNNLVISFKKIINSIFKYPLPIKNCLDAYKLKGVGKRFSYYFEKALTSSQNENKYNCNSNNNVSNISELNINNHLNKVIKSADDFLREINELYDIKKKGDISENDHVLKNLKEIENDDIYKEYKNHKCIQKKNNNDCNSSFHLNENSDSLCLSMEPDKCKFTSFLDNSNILDEKKKKDIIVPSHDKLEKRISHSKNILTKKKKEIELNDLEIRILSVIDKYGYLYNGNAMRKEEIAIEFLKNYKKNVNINFRILNRLIKLDLLEKVECVENCDWNNSNISKEKKIKLKIVNKIKLTEKGKEFVNQEKGKLLEVTPIIKKEYEKHSIKIYNTEEENLSTNINKSKENFKSEQKVSTEINESQENIKNEIVHYDKKNNSECSKQIGVKEDNLSDISLVECDSDELKMDFSKKNEKIKCFHNSIPDIEEKLSYDLKEKFRSNYIFKKERDINVFLKCDNSISSLYTNNEIGKSDLCYVDKKNIDNESNLVLLNNNEEEGILNHISNLVINKKENDNISENKYILKITKNSDTDKKKKMSFDSEREKNLVEEKKESNYLEKKIEYRIKEIKNKLSLKERLEKKKLDRDMSNSTSSLSKCSVVKENDFVCHEDSEIIEKEKENEKNEILLFSKNKIYKNKDSLMNAYEDNSIKLIISDFKRKKNNSIGLLNYSNSKNKNEEKTLLREEINKVEDNDSGIIMCSNKKEGDLNSENNYEINGHNNANTEYDDEKEKKKCSNSDSDKSMKIRKKTKLINYDIDMKLKPIMSKYNFGNDNKIENVETYNNKENDIDIIDLSKQHSDKKNYLNNSIKKNKEKAKRSRNIFNEKGEIEIKDEDYNGEERNKKKKRKKNECELEKQNEKEKEKEKCNNQVIYGPYEIIMVIDNRDISGANCEYYEKMKKIFKENNVKYTTRNLPLGDTIWICRRAIYKDNNNSSKKKKATIKKKKEEKEINEENNIDSLNKNYDDIINNNEEENIKYEEYVLKWIVERKTLNDLSASIVDGRYDEQKYRLMRSKEMYHIIYLIENCNNSYKNYVTCSKISYETLMNAQNSTQLVNGFSILNSQNMKHTLFLLSEIHFQIVKNVKRVCELKENEVLNGDKLSLYLKNNSCLWEIWNNESKKSKNNIVREVFGKQLRLINMCGSDATELILSLWSTPFKLNQALNKYTHDGILAEKIKRIYVKNYEINGKKKIKSPINAQLIAQLRQLYAPDTI